MICPKCQCKEVCEEIITHQFECRNHLFCFEEVPVPRCPECGTVFLSEEIVHTMLTKVEQLTQKSSISYHKCRWPRAQADEAEDLPTEGVDNEENSE